MHQEEKGGETRLYFYRIFLLKWLQLVGQDYYFEISEHRRLNTVHRPGNLDETVARAVIGMPFVS